MTSQSESSSLQFTSNSTASIKYENTSDALIHTQAFSSVKVQVGELSLDQSVSVVQLEVESSKWSSWSALMYSDSLDLLLENFSWSISLVKFLEAKSFFSIVREALLRGSTGSVSLIISFRTFCT